MGTSVPWDSVHLVGGPLDGTTLTEDRARFNTKPGRWWVVGDKDTGRYMAYGKAEICDHCGETLILHFIGYVKESDLDKTRVAGSVR